MQPSWFGPLSHGGGRCGRRRRWCYGAIRLLHSCIAAQRGRCYTPCGHGRCTVLRSLRCQQRRHWHDWRATVRLCCGAIHLCCGTVNGRRCSGGLGRQRTQQGQLHVVVPVAAAKRRRPAWRTRHAARNLQWDTARDAGCGRSGSAAGGRQDWRGQCLAGERVSVLLLMLRLCS